MRFKIISFHISNLMSSFCCRVDLMLLYLFGVVHLVDIYTCPSGEKEKTRSSQILYLANPSARSTDSIFSLFKTF